MIHAPVSPAPRLASLDVYRGWTVLLMMAEVLRIGQIAEHYPDSGSGSSWPSAPTRRPGWLFAA